MGILCWHGLGYLDEGAGRICRSADHGPPLSRGHATVAALMGTGRSSCRHFALLHPGRSLVRSHVPDPRRRLLFASTGSYSGPLSRSDGGTWGGLVVLHSRVAARVLSLEQLPACRTLSGLCQLACIPYPTDARTIRVKDVGSVSRRTGLVHGALDCWRVYLL